MGNASARAQPIYQLDSFSLYRTYLLEYSNQTGNLVFVELVGDGKFMKSVHGKCDGQPVIIKIYRLCDPNEKLDSAEAAIKRVVAKLSNQPNIMPYADWQLSMKSNVAFLIRQFFLSSLSDRFNTRPFLTPIEKKWLAFQLLKALEQAHSSGVCHGDIKPENIMVTSWNWIMLTDFAPFKPTYLPEDDPSDYYYYFCATDNSKRCCNIAPERFYSSESSKDFAVLLSDLVDSQVSIDALNEKSGKEGVLRPAMDIFSMGCVIGEIFLGGNPVFDLPSLLRYRTGKGEAKQLRKIQDKQAQDLVKHMLQRDPRTRLSAEEYREKCTGPTNVFPEYFEEFLFPFMEKLLNGEGKIPDKRIQFVCESYGQILKELAGVEDPDGVIFFKHRLEDSLYPNSECSKTLARRVFDEIDRNLSQMTRKKKFIHDAPKALADLNEKIQHTLTKGSESDVDDIARPSLLQRTSSSFRLPDDPRPEEAPKISDTNGIVLILRLVCSSLRHVGQVHSKLTGIHLITRLAAFADDETRLDQLVPFILQLFSDGSAFVRATALRSITKLLWMVRSFPLSEAGVFPQYIFPALVKFPSDPDEIVRIAFAECLPKIAETSRRFLEIAQAMKVANESTRSDEFGFDKELRRLHQMISRFVVQIAAPDQKASSSQVKRALLDDITRLCIFFGRERTLDIVLPQLIAVLNDRDPQVRCAFFQNITGVCVLVGRVSLELYILPCIEQALVDVEELVIARALKCLGTLCELGLFQRHGLIEKAKNTSPLLFHPNESIRQHSIALIAAVSNQLGPVDVHAFLIPILRPYLNYDSIGKIVNVDTLRNALQPPVSREAFDAALITTNITEQDEKLQLMSKYVQVAASHMQCKLQVAGSEQSAAHLRRSSMNSSKIPKSLVHTLRVPHMRFALLHAPPIRPSDANEISFLIRLHGLQAVATVPQYSSSTEESSIVTPTKLDDPALVNSSKLQSRISCLNIPPLAPDMGPLRSDDGVLFSLYSLPGATHGGRNQPTGVATSATHSITERLPIEVAYRGWKPKENTLVAELAEHSGAVNRLAVSQDYNFFASGSVDGTVKVWSTKGLYHAVSPSSMYTYNLQSGCINDITMCDNSHSIASASSNGTVHVFKVEGKQRQNPTASMASISVVCERDVGNHEVVSIGHMNNITESLLVYAALNGNIYGWDLRFRRMSWTFRVTPELGYITALTHARDATWLAAGTNRGFICLWDVRFQLLVSVWRHPSHSTIHRMILCPALTNDTRQYSSPLIHVAAGANESAVFDLSNGASRSVFRILKAHVSEKEATSCHSLEHVPTTPQYKQQELLTVLGSNGYVDALHDLQTMTSCSSSSIRALLAPNRHFRGLDNTLITAGEDRHIRFWNLTEPKSSFSISGISPGEPKSFYDSQIAAEEWWQSGDGEKRAQGLKQMAKPLIYMCQDTTIAAAMGTNPASERRGPVPPTSGHNDCILDLNMLDLRVPVVVSGGRDGLIKIWR